MVTPTLLFRLLVQRLFRVVVQPEKVPIFAVRLSAYVALSCYRRPQFQKIISSMRSPQEITSILEERFTARNAE